jgi:hypothetical protein
MVCGGSSFSIVGLWGSARRFDGKMLAFWLFSTVLWRVF